MNVQGQNARGRAFVITINNYSEEMKESLMDLPIIDYGVLGAEIGENGTCHLQGYLQLNQQQTVTALQKKLVAAGIRSWIAIARGTPEQNFTYCSKDHEITEWGTMKESGKRTDLDEIYKLIEAGKSEEEILAAFPKQWYRYYKAFAKHNSMRRDRIFLAKLKLEMELVNLRQWQKDVVSRLLAQNNRKVLWVVDIAGNTGKSFLAKWLFAKHDAFEIVSGKTGDIAYAYKGQNIVVFDLSRQKEEYMNYGVIENFKNGKIFSPKFESKNMRFEPCKVVVFANWEPNYEKLSKDKWDMFVMGSVPSNVAMIDSSALVDGFVFDIDN